MDTLGFGLPKILAEIFIYIDLSYSYGYFESLLLSTQETGSTQTQIPTILDVNVLNLQSYFFKIKMMSNV
jgi:hypothetical protein